MMNKKHTNHHLLKIKDIKTMCYNMMMMHEKSKMRQIPRRCRPVAALSPRSTFFTDGFHPTPSDDISVIKQLQIGLSIINS
ncbi:hypothetical protein CKD10_15550 [Salmonella enterica subsp. enterica serovar Newport]|nr:hypothetical protein [Salmonella enterica]EBC9879930.1 hypothetical protein [Salmonella enterica subsp. enterica serovar Newport]ECF6896418.1 hypothetical protein [Salmonella enterica subsp. enterica serovar Litchfield]EDR2627721.1 hypothetical protein [Salmonella enterica subsp. enterica serovar Thompson]HAE6205677.1 hypothetical protein [Salmonella enterica subsp. diarizonae serovar 50:l,v:z35]HAU6821971.1 hypothetical protein [Salmonella enterica subsp. enterica serovar Brandenburg]